MDGTCKGFKVLEKGKEKREKPSSLHIATDCAKKCHSGHAMNHDQA